MRLNNVLVCLLLAAGVFGGDLAYRSDRSSRVTLFLQEPGVDVTIGGTTIHNAERTEVFDLSPGVYNLRVSKGHRPLYYERITVGTDDEQVVRAAWPLKERVGKDILAGKG